MPECVAELIKHAKDNNKTIRWCLYGNCKELYPQAAEWIGADDDIEFTDKTWKQQEIFVRAWLDGFTVEKPQLFYLKHIDMSERNRYFDYYLERDGDESLGHKRVDKGKMPGTGFNKGDYTFTQQEIDSMQTGSYEQIEVTE